jgi:site-specific recombinase XerD
MESYIFPSLIEKFITRLKEQGKSHFTVIAYQKDLEQFVGFLSAAEVSDIRDVKKEHIEGFLSKLLADNYTKKSASRKLNSIRTFFRHLKANEIIESNPSLEVSHPKYVATAPRTFSKMEYRAIRDVAKDDARTYAMIEILLQTGLKIGELANLRVGDVKDDAIFIRTYGKSPARNVPLNKAVKKAVDTYVKARENGSAQGRKAQVEDYLFITRTGKPLLIRNIRQIVTRCFREVGINNATVNDFRNTFIAHQLGNGHSIEEIAKIVGHRRLSSTERFLQMVVDDGDKKKRLEEL